MGFSELVVSYYTTIAHLPPIQRRGVVSLLNTISKKGAASQILLEIVACRAATGRSLITKLGIIKPTFYNSVKWLLENNFIVKAAPLGRGGAGRQGTIYAIPEYTPEDLAMAVTEDKFLGTPGFKEIRRLADVVAEGYIDYLRPFDSEFLDRRKLHEVLKKECKGFRWFDLKRDIEYELMCRGFKVA